MPDGFIVFVPNASKGTRGPGGGAKIINGSYATPRDKGVVGGHYLVRIRGTDGVPVVNDLGEEASGTILFSEYEAEVEFPSEDATQDFEVPTKEPSKPGR
ncbi:hypothetical protein [Kolteria novifilia]|uniref:hypothetical protein n=1 Tax=Kolteria novifilia TaxID=2527975 RepID=UPI003AF3A4CF